MNRNVDEQSFVTEFICSLDFVIFHSSPVLDVLVAITGHVVLHDADLIPLHLSLESEVSLAVSPRGVEVSGLVVVTHHRGSEVCPPKPQWGVIPKKRKEKKERKKERNTIQSAHCQG